MTRSRAQRFADVPYREDRASVEALRSELGGRGGDEDRVAWRRRRNVACGGRPSLRRCVSASGAFPGGSPMHWDTSMLSAVLPVLAAAYRSPEVSVMLVIDPSGTTKCIVWLRPDTLALDVMSSEAWSIDGLIVRRGYWSAAEWVLQHTAGRGASNAAALLLGRAAWPGNAYWDRETGAHCRRRLDGAGLCCVLQSRRTARWGPRAPASRRPRRGRRSALPPRPSNTSRRL